MKQNKIGILCMLAFVALFSVTTSAQEVVKEKAYQLRVQPGWTRTQNLPQGIDVGFTKRMTEGDYATFYFHYEVMPAESGRTAF